MDRAETRERTKQSDSPKISPKEVIGFRILSSLLVMYILTGILLFIMALLLYKLQLGETFVTVGVMVAYVASSFCGGLVMGWRMKAPCGFLGLLTGCGYFFVLFVGSIILNHGLPEDVIRMMAVWIMCSCGGMLGAMIYPR